MNMNKLIAAVLSIGMLMTLASNDVEAQRFSSKKKYWSIGGNLNMSHYVGDVTASRSRFSFPLRLTRENIGICALRRVAPRVSWRGNLFYGVVKGDDRLSSSTTEVTDFGRYERGIRFKNNFWELSGTVIIDFYENRGTWKKRPDYTPYAFVGLGAFWQNLKMSGHSYAGDTYADGSPKPTAAEWVNANGIAHVGGSRLQGSFIYGLGFRYKLAKRWDLALEVGWRKTTTDRMDGVDGVEYYPGVRQDDGSLDWSNFSGTNYAIYDNSATTQVDGNNIATAGTTASGHPYTAISAPGEVRGNKAFDGYIVTGLHLTRILGGGVICPKFR